jgi:hypothetical protein
MSAERADQKGCARLPRQGNQPRLSILLDQPGLHQPRPAYRAVPPTGRSFRTISIDMFTVSGGKLSTAYHVENWAAAMQQIKLP